MAIADEYVEKLPAFLTIPQIALVLRIPHHDVRELIFSGELIAVDHGGEIEISPAENTHYLMQAMLLRLPLPHPSHQDTSLTVELTLSEDAHAELIGRAAAHGISPSELIEAVLRTTG
jgi:plasmid stability protein